MEIREGDRIKFAGERNSYRVMAADDRFAVCMKPFNAQKTTIYTIVDQQDQVRGPDNKIFGGPYESQADADRALGQLQRGEISVSRRRSVKLEIDKIITGNTVQVREPLVSN